MAEIIQARVWQKVDTEANWLANPLPLGSGEQAFVSDKNNFKVNTFTTKKTFSELEYFYKGDVIGNVTLSDDLSLKSDGVYYAQTSGTYGGVVVKEGYYTLLRKTGNVWSLESEVKMPEVDVSRFEASSEVVDKLLPSLIKFDASINIADPQLLMKGYYAINGNYGDTFNWIHIKIPVKPSTTYTISGLATLAPPNVRVVMFNESGSYVSHVLANGSSANVTITTGANVYSMAINLQNKVGIGTNPQNTIFATTLQIEEGEIATPYVSYVADSYKVDYNKLANKPTSIIPDVFVSFDKNGGTYSKGLLMVYCKRKGGKDDFIGFKVIHQYDMSDNVYTDQWRISSADNYTYNGTDMVLTKQYGGLYVGESEFVYKRTNPDSADFTGGVHGDEILIDCDILIDGVIIDKNVNILLKAVKEVSYIQKSNTYTTANIEQTLTTHEIEGFHVKKTTFRLGGYDTYNYLKFIKAVEGYIYGGISCIGNSNANYMFNEDFNKVQVLSDNVTNKINGYNLREVNYSNSTNGYGAIVRSYLLEDEANDKLCRLMVHDRPNDAKYYRNTPTKIYAINSFVKTLTNVDFYKN